MDRNAALEAVKSKYVMEDETVIDLCLRRLRISRTEFETYLAFEPKTFRDYNTGYKFMILLKPLIKYVTKLGFLPTIVYDKYFLCGE